MALSCTLGITLTLTILPLFPFSWCYQSCPSYVDLYANDNQRVVIQK